MSLSPYQNLFKHLATYYITKTKNKLLSDDFLFIFLIKIVLNWTIVIIRNYYII
ncbi:hypothetical protein JOD43_003043 [Pullulanibacillus pueri]|nr:hypothetical protein [Pullulanibacillus pueri]